MAKRGDRTQFESIVRSIELVQQGKLSAQKQFLERNTNKLMRICNGCGAADSKFDFVPDTIWGLWIGPICNIHDFDYHVGKTEADRLRADLHMLENILRAIEACSNRFLKKIRRVRALTYYQAVRDFGAGAFEK